MAVGVRFLPGRFRLSVVEDLREDSGTDGG